MNKNTIWVIDDDVIYQTIITKLIKKAGLFSSYFIFKNGKEALMSLRSSLESEAENIPEIILLDINMPIMDGWEFMEEIEKIKPQIKKEIIIYIVSSSIAIGDKKKSKCYTNITGYLPKPITVDDLIAINTKH